MMNDFPIKPKGSLNPRKIIIYYESNLIRTQERYYWTLVS